MLLQKEKSTHNAILRIVVVGLMSALVFALSSVSIQLGEISRIHFGNIMCLLSGVLFGPLVGGLSAGLGSMFYDFTNPLYFSEFWITFLTKFAMGFVAGALAKGLYHRLPAALRYIVPSAAGSLTYVALYMIKSAIMQHYVNGNPWVAVWPTVATKGFISLVNGIIAVAAVTVFAPALRAALERSGMFRSRKRA